MRKEQEFVKALGLPHGLEFHATVDDGNVVRGQTVNVTACAWHNESLVITYAVTLGADARYSQP